MFEEISTGSYLRLDSIIKSQTKNSNVDGNKNVYLASGGYFQDEYIALFEGLTNYSPNEDNPSETEVEYDNARFIAGLFFKKLLSEYKGKPLNFNKIFSVTIPSQIIAKFLFEEIEREFYYNSEMKFYSNTKGKISYERKLPSLIRLSSYYSFDEEINFQNIKAGDRVLIINDVISTGNLIVNIIDSISKKVIDENYPNLKAKVEKVLCVVDTRIDEENIKNLLITKPELKVEDINNSIFFYSNSFLSENDIISLRKKNIVKYKKRPDYLIDAKLIRINPILNAPVTFPTRHSEEDKIAYKDPIHFLEQLPSKDLKIGHFSQNSLHHSYFIKPNDLFKKDINTGMTNEVGIKLFQSVINKVYILENSIDLNYYLESLTMQLEALKTQTYLFDDTDSGTNSHFDISIKEINKIKNFVKTDKSIDFVTFKNKLKVDYVFRPVFSGVELLSRTDITKFCDVELSNIIELHRFDTIKGWRFIIPPKYLNDPTVDKTALIIDMGSFSGDSIVQMVDAVSVYQLKKIIVVSLIGRLEDFDREFLSRMREIKVKRRKKKNEIKDKLPDNTVANINIYFGTHLHIPPYPSTKVCKFCNEKEKIESYLQVKECTSIYVRNYIESRRRELKLVHVNEVTDQCPSYFPKMKDQSNEIYDTLNFYKIRNNLGKIDGYRFYEDYYTYFDNLSFGSIHYNRDMEAIIALCLHESHLLVTIKNQLPDIYKNLQSFILQIINTNKIDDLHYLWNKNELLKFHLIINEHCLLNNEDLIKIFEFTENSIPSINQLLFFVWEKHYNYRKEINKRFSVYEFRDNIFEVKKIVEKQYEELLKETINICFEFEYNAFSEIDLSFYKLKLFFQSEEEYNSQPKKVSTGRTPHPSIYNAINGLKTPLNRCEIKNSDFGIYINEFKNNWKQKKGRLQHELIEPLEKIKDLIKSCDTDADYDYIHLDSSPENIVFLINSIDTEIRRLNNASPLENIKKIKEYIDLILLIYLSGRSKFAKFCISFLHFNPITLLNSYFELNDFKSLKIPKNKLQKYISNEKSFSDYLINIHPLILQCVYKEIFINYKNHGDNSDFEIRNELSENNFILTFRQKQFTKEHRQNEKTIKSKICLKNLEEGILSPFGIKFYSNRSDFYNLNIDKQPEYFIQEIKIPIFKSFKNGNLR